ncbi:MAG: hypothetical protein IPM70_12835 [Proteobacteria bacterium]|nr:hypothetical protein [Pseudomonadota bacterium]
MRTAIRLAIMPALLLTMSAQAQQKVPFANGVPVAPTGLADQVLPAGPFDMRTGEGQDIRVTVLARDIEYPYSLAFLPNGDLLFTERTGRLRGCCAAANLIRIR